MTFAWSSPADKQTISEFLGSCSFHFYTIPPVNTFPSSIIFRPWASTRCFSQKQLNTWSLKEAHNIVLIKKKDADPFHLLLRSSQCSGCGTPQMKALVEEKPSGNGSTPSLDHAPCHLQLAHLTREERLLLLKRNLGKFCCAGWTPL